MVSLSDIFQDDDEIEDRVSELKESVRPSADLVYDLVHWLENGKTEPPRKPGLHCSSLWKTCARVPLLEKKYASSLVVEEIKAGNRLTFDMGHALHDMMQNAYLGPLGRLYGEWKCIKCQKIVHKGTMPQDCPECKVPWRNPKDGVQNIVYSELFVHDEELDYCGHCDGVLIGRSGKRRVFEFKTKSKSQFATLRGPDTPHITQVHAYMNGLGLDEAIILYWDKGSQCDWSRDDDGRWHAGNVHLKAFDVKFDQGLWVAMSKRIKLYHEAKEKAASLPIVQLEDIMAYKRVCTHASCDLAKSCSVTKQCFSLPS